MKDNLTKKTEKGIYIKGRFNSKEYHGKVIYVVSRMFRGHCDDIYLSRNLKDSIFKTVDVAREVEGIIDDYQVCITRYQWDSARKDYAILQPFDFCVFDFYGGQRVTAETLNDCYDYFMQINRAVAVYNQNNKKNS